jgi:hypothetical protein
MKVIQLRRHMLKPSSNECRASRIPTDLYMSSDSAVVGIIMSLSHCSAYFISSSGAVPSHCASSLGSPFASTFSWARTSRAMSAWRYSKRSTLSQAALLSQSSSARDSSAGLS